ncbi:MAG: LamG domain-containing protein, partial [Planctomycetota bacterium]
MRSGLLAMVALATVMSPVVVAQVTCPTDVIAEWRLDTLSSGISPDERADHPLFCIDDCPTPTAGQIDGALAFDGIDDGIAASSEPSFDFGPTDSFAFEAWVRPAASTGDFRFVLGRVQPGSVGWVLGQDGSGVAAFDLVATNGEGSDPANLLRGTTDLSDGNWHHLVGVRDGASGQTLLYVDGVLEDSTTLTYTAGFDSDFAIITVGYATSSFGPQRFVGDLDAITVYNRALTPA